MSRRLAVLLFGCILIVSATALADSITITIAQDQNSFTFTNPSIFSTATDFELTLLTVGGPGIGGGNGGAPFAGGLALTGPHAGGGFNNLTFSGDLGIPPGGTYKVKFIGFPIGTQFKITFTPIEVILASSPGQYSTTGRVTAVPEPSAFLLFASGLAGMAAFMRRKLCE
jgi:hypothetical protein